MVKEPFSWILNVILKEALKAVGFGTATVRAQRYNDDAIPAI
jgi:hypothetical protein